MGGPRYAFDRHLNTMDKLNMVPNHTQEQEAKSKCFPGREVRMTSLQCQFKDGFPTNSAAHSQSSIECTPNGATLVHSGNLGSCQMTLEPTSKAASSDHGTQSAGDCAYP